MVSEFFTDDYELARRNLVDAFANAPSPSAMMH
jgi:hypothetical protein